MDNDSKIRYLTPNEQKAEMERDQRDYMRQCIDEEKKRSSNYFFGFWGAFSGALAGALCYACIRSGGWIAALVGAFMVYMAAKGYDATNVKRNINKLYCVVIASVLALPIGEFLGFMIYVMADETAGVYVSGYLEYYIKNFAEFLLRNIDGLFLGYLFTAIGSFKLLTDIKKHDKKLEEMEEYLAQYEEAE